MGYTTMPTITTGDVATAAWGNTYLRDNQRAQRGEDGVVTIESGLIIDETDGDEYFRLPKLTTAERNALTPVNGMTIYNETRHHLEQYINGAWAEVVAPAIASAAQGDIVYKSGADTWARLGPGTSGQFLQTKGAGANPQWATASTPFQWVYPVTALDGGDGSGIMAQAQEGDFYTWHHSSINSTGRWWFKVALPSGFVSLSKAVLVFWSGETNSVRYSVTTDFAANGEARTTHSDSIAAATQALTADQIFELDISAALTGVAAGDYIGLEFVRDATHVDDTIINLYVIGLLLEFS